MIRMRAPMSFAAAFIVIVLVAAVLVLGRLGQPVPHPAPVHQPTPAAINQAEVSRLEALPLHLPTLAAGEVCNEGPFDTSGRYGLGPAYGLGGIPADNSWGTQWHVRIAIDRRVTGLVLIRGRDLTTHQPVLFGGDYAYGPSGDTVRTDLHTEALFDMGTKAGQGELVFPITTALKAGHSACVALQIDGQGFSETFKGGA